jgi:hypothetical protein
MAPGDGARAPAAPPAGHAGLPRACGRLVVKGQRRRSQELSGALAAKDKAAGQRLRAVAVELIRRGLQVALVGYLDGWTELEAGLPQAPHLGPVTLDRDTAGTTCQLAWDCWADISTEDGAGQVAEAVAALLGGLAGCPSLTRLSALGAPRGPVPADSPGQHPGPGQAGQLP